MNERLKIPYPVIVEGAYDKLRLEAVMEGQILTTDGFGVFRRQEKAKLFCRLAERTPIILLTDSDGAGKVIRAHITSAIPKDKLIQLYTPQVEGKEKRKQAPSAEGFLGVEGADADVLRELLAPFATDAAADTKREEITKADMFALGLTGGNDSAERRDGLAVKLGLPKNMTPNAFLAALNVLIDKKELERLCEQ